MLRRDFIRSSAAVLALGRTARAAGFDLAAIERGRVLKAADRYLAEAPITVTAASSPRSAGGKHDFFSEGDYWWPDPKNPDGPYVQRDGMTNPDNFTKHREYMMRLSVQAPALAAAFKITGNPKYAAHAVKHLRAWFVDESTRMNPNLEYAQAIHGRYTGRGTGIIDTIHLVEVARAVEVLAARKGIDASDLAGVKNWFAGYIQWLTTHKYGHDERDAKNNHGTCWVMQVAEFAHLTGNTEQLEWCRNRLKTVLIPDQMAADGSFPLELKRTKPYSYSIFNLDVMSAVCQILSTPGENLWKFETADGRGMRKAIAFLYPYIKDKKSWPYPHDVMHFDDFPVRQPNLLFGGLAYGNQDWLDLWRTLDPDPTVEEVIRNFPIRQPVLWV
jgi:hypothetical protein